jgi:hypothetical protein
MTEPAKPPMPVATESLQISLSLTGAQINQLLALLGKEPLNTVIDLFMTIKMQGNAAVQQAMQRAATEAASAAGAPSALPVPVPMPAAPPSLKIVPDPPAGDAPVTAAD